MSEKEILLTIKSCAMDYAKQEEGMHTFEWADLWTLNEYISDLQQKVNQLEEQLNNPLRGIFARVTDDELLRSHAAYYAENKELYKEVKQLEHKLNKINTIVSEIEEKKLPKYQDKIRDLKFWISYDYELEKVECDNEMSPEE